MVVGTQWGCQTEPPLLIFVGLVNGAHTGATWGCPMVQTGLGHPDSGPVGAQLFSPVSLSCPMGGPVKLLAGLI